MSKDSFDRLLAMVGPSITYQDTVLRNDSIDIFEKLKFLTKYNKKNLLASAQQTGLNRGLGAMSNYLIASVR